MHIDHSLKYPIGKFNYLENADVDGFISRLESLPMKLKTTMEPLDGETLQWRYRPEGWRLFQVVHHIADSHINAYTRMKIAFTENGKSITSYAESEWAELADVHPTNMNDSLSIIFLVHKKLVTFLRSIPVDKWNNAYYHPEDQVLVPLKEAVQIYAWHGDHHLAHLKQGIASGGKY